MEVNMEQFIIRQLEESIEVKRLVRESLVSQIAQAAGLVIEAYRKGGKVLLLGNGGSAADAQHIAAELIGRFERERRPLPAIALPANTSSVTAVANDYGYEFTFARQVEALAQEGDVVIGISTSGDSPNVLEAVKAAQENGTKTIGLSGRGGGKLRELAELCIIVPSDSTPRIQEAHITIGHIVCSLVEREMFGDE